ncbi:hypothetical protein C8Q77DRAFT_89424 [Trametes polyzona]|nr:hypothetical protein C8Q77DRAFT_89424 [Trametes polyzona]
MLDYEGHGYVTPDDASDCTARPSTGQPSPSSLLTSTPDPAYLSAVRPSRSAGYFSNRFASLSDLSRFTISAYAEPWVSNDSLAASPSGPVYQSAGCGPTVSPSGSIVISSADDGPYLPLPPPPFYQASACPSTESIPSYPAAHLAPPPSRSWSTISSVLFNRRPISPSPSATSTAASEENSPSKNRFRFPLTGRNHAKPRSPSLQSGLAGHESRSLPASGKPSYSTPTSPLATHFGEHPRPLLGPSTSSGSASGRCLGSGFVGCSGHPHGAPPSPLVPDLPTVLGWLRDTSIELWIDQEGFRAIRPKFRLAAYAAPPAEGCPEPTHPSSLAHTLTHGLAVFCLSRPTRGVYHHGALDSAPVLRRLTLAGNEDKDYISRHASLTVKANGIYAVCGTEHFEEGLPPFPAHAHGPALQLRWRFEYAVDDLSGATAGNGDKAFVPLSFACSPGLLHPSHGKPIKLMHVLKKNIAPKLSAKRASVDVDGALQAIPELFYAGTAGVTGRPDKKIKGVSAHRRTRSSDPSSAPTTVWPPADGPTLAKKARPASICATLSSPQPQPNLPSPSEKQHTRGHVHTHSMASSRLSTHIVSPQELAQILAAFPDPEGGARTGPHPTALSPPSYYRHRRTPSDMERIDEMGALVV